MAENNLGGHQKGEVFHDVMLEASDDDDDNGGGVQNEGLSTYTFRPHVPVTSRYVPRRGLARYSESLKHLIPFRKRDSKRNVIQVDAAGFFSLVTFSWMSKYIYQAYKKGLTIDNIPLCSPHDSCDLNAQRLELLWQDELGKKGPKEASFGRAVWRFTRTRLIISCVVFIVSCMLGFLNPAFFMRRLLQYSEDPQAETADGITWALAFTLCELFRTMSLALCYSISYRTAIKLRAACLVLAYRKLIHMNSLGSKLEGKIINLYGSDGARLCNMIIFGPMVIGGPIAATCCALYIYFILGPWALLGMLTFLLFYPVQYLLSRLSGYFRRRTIRKTDERIKLMTEIITTIKLIKMYAWEPCFSSKIKDVREKELSFQQRAAYCESVGISMASTIPVISGILTFIVHVLSGGNLTAAQAYPLVTLLHSQLRGSLQNLRYGSESLIDGQITFGRIKELLVMEEIGLYVPPPGDDNISLSVTDGFFTWYDYARETPSRDSKRKLFGKKGGEKERPAEKRSKEVFTLQSINLCVPKVGYLKGSLVGICGAVGSGKTSLLMACLGQMKMISGSICRAGRSAYVSQESWIENATFKENILFGEAFDPKRYINTLYCCALNEDVNFFPAGDDTEIGERGINLSGGQKQRVSLARALYCNRDVYFLDDPLSAVDAHVASHIFENCILNALGKKTVFMVTHQVKYLQKCDEILVMKEGKIVERGTHHELLSKGREYCDMVESSTLISVQNTMEGSEGKKDGEEDGGERERNGGDGKEFRAKFTASEEQIKGQVRSVAYRAYVRAAGGFVVCFIVFASILVNVGSSAFSSWWLAMWIKSGSGNATVVDPATNETVVSTYINDNPDVNFYMQVYGLVIGVICATSLLRGVIFTKVTIKASRTLHKNIFDKLMKTRLRHVEVTPIGRFQNIFSRDLNEIDSRLPGILETMIQNIWTIMFAFLFITMVFPWFLVALSVLAVVYYLVGKVFRVAIRDLKRIEAMSRAPIFSSITATVTGLPIIHAFDKEGDHLSRFYKRYDENSVCTYMTCCAMRWMAIRLDCISVAIGLITSMLVVMLKGEIAPALAGLALTYSAHISGVFQYTLRLMSETEGKFIAVERILLNMQKLESESNPRDSVRVPSNWPSQGFIQFQNVALSYSSDAPPVLNGVSFSVRGGEKIGIVGRTGAGKSSLVAALFRLVEVSSGAIHIDGVDISGVSLDVLRSRLSVIPQDPKVFGATLRSNLDPCNEHDDDAIWKVLKQTRLMTKVQSMENGLSTVMGEGRENLSVGESQLLCLARALLRGSKVLVLDEATASLDPDTEAAVQATVDEYFSRCTILTIAHRLSTVKNCERVLVMHQGTVQEFDEPNKLLENPNSHFAKMIGTLK